jgi:hypothetical protein
MNFPLPLWAVSLWIAITAIILLVTSELIGPYSDHLGDFVIDKTRLKITALLLGAAFMITVILRIVLPT